MMFGPDGTRTKSGDTNVITFQRTVDASPDRVWKVITTQDGITSWLAISASIDGREGGSIEIEFDAEQSVDGVVTRWDPTSHFSHTWVINGAITSDVQDTLEPVDGGAQITLVHSGLSDEMCGGYTPGWHAYLARLAAAINGATIPGWMAVFEEVAPSYG